MEDFSPSVEYVDGVPVVSAPLESAATATLLFTVGGRDETPRTAGVAHLVEHVVMRRVGRVSAPHNAVTDADSIRFFVTGTDEQIVDFLSRVTEAISWLPESTEADIAPERRTIGTELGPAGEEGGIGPLVMRYGLVDIGLVDFGQAPHRTLPVAAVHDFASRYLHRGNAAVTITGKVPSGLRLALPAGERRAVRTTPTTLRADLPGWVIAGGAPLILNFEVACDPSRALVVQACLDAMLQRTLRIEQGLIYSTGVFAFGLDDDLGNVSIAMDPDLESIPAALEGAVRGLQAVASAGPDPDDFAHAQEMIASSAVHHEARIDWLATVAVAEARGRGDELPPLADELAKIAAVTADDVRETVAESLAGLVVTVAKPDLDPAIPEALGLRPMTNESTLVPPNVTHTFRGVSRDEFGVLGPKMRRGLRGYSLFVSEHVLAEIGPDGVFEVALADVVLVGRRANGILNFATRTGRVFFLQPADWRDPRGWIRRAIDSIPADLFYERAD